MGAGRRDGRGPHRDRPGVRQGTWLEPSQPAVRTYYQTPAATEQGSGEEDMLWSELWNEAEPRVDHRPRQGGAGVARSWRGGGKRLALSLKTEPACVSSGENMYLDPSLTLDAEIDSRWNLHAEGELTKL